MSNVNCAARGAARRVRGALATSLLRLRARARAVALLLLWMYESAHALTPIRSVASTGTATPLVTCRREERGAARYARGAPRGAPSGASRHLHPQRKQLRAGVGGAALQRDEAVAPRVRVALVWRRILRGLRRVAPGGVGSAGRPAARVSREGARGRTVQLSKMAKSAQRYERPLSTASASFNAKVLAV